MSCRLILLLILLLAPTAIADYSSIEFNRDIRPILSNKCFTCHGPDDKHREAELRLDLRDAAIQAGTDRKVIVPGKVPPDKDQPPILTGTIVQGVGGPVPRVIAARSKKSRTKK